jgi:hypothetical protein|tara:strand:- start:548 stop:727 length:180 start_codon:yes stop_codon:yes gene_type:complete
MTKSEALKQKQILIVDSQLEEIQRKLDTIKNSYCGANEKYAFLHSIARNANKAIKIIEV